ncbi:MAG: hypothetical protein JHC95_09545 [Solirubrobacteraceae bacterium]|nr:hypothetical protein [Solirubrobacteraceae bacterium]
MLELDALPAAAKARVVPVTDTQWARSVSDAQLPNSLARHATTRAAVTSVTTATDSQVGPELRPAVVDFVREVVDLVSRLDLLCALDPSTRAHASAIEALRAAILRDARRLLESAVRTEPAPEAPAWPQVANVAPDDKRDVLLDLFGVPGDALTDVNGAFCDARVIAAYRLRLPELQQRCDAVTRLVADHEPHVFIAVSATRDLATSRSPWLSLYTAKACRSHLLEAFAADRSRTSRILGDAYADMDKEAMTFSRLQDRVGKAEVATTERGRAIALAEAYKVMAEGHTRRWVSVLLRLTGSVAHPLTVGQLAEPARAHLGLVGERVAGALLPAVRNAEAHEDFDFDEDTGLLIAGRNRYSTEEIHNHLSVLDVLQRGWIAGRLGAFTDRPELSEAFAEHTDNLPHASRINFAKQRFAHAGQQLRTFERNRDVLTVRIDDLQSDACNPLLLALTQAAFWLPNVHRYTVFVGEHELPVIDISAEVLRANFEVLHLAGLTFQDQLPQVTFLPILAHARLAVEAVPTAARAVAWMALNDAQHAINDAGVSPLAARRLARHLELVAVAATVSSRVLPQGDHLEPVDRAANIARTTAEGVTDGITGVVRNVMLDRVLRIRDRLGPAPAVLPTLDPSPLPPGGWPHKVS